MKGLEGEDKEVKFAVNWGTCGGLQREGDIGMIMKKSNFRSCVINGV